jgi:flavin-dependent dehydrogenase
MHGWAARPGFVRRSGGPGWALVGDASRFNDPITTHGMTDGLRDAELLTDQLVAAFSGAVPEAVALSRYQAMRQRLSARLTVATEAVAAYDWDTEDLQVLMRQVSSATSDEVDYLQSLPQRHVPPGLSAGIPVAGESRAD